MHSVIQTLLLTAICKSPVSSIEKGCVIGVATHPSYPTSGQRAQKAGGKGTDFEGFESRGLAHREGLRFFLSFEKPGSELPPRQASGEEGGPHPRSRSMTDAGNCRETSKFNAKCALVSTIQGSRQFRSYSAPAGTLVRSIPPSGCTTLTIRGACRAFGVTRSALPR